MPAVFTNRLVSRYFSDLNLALLHAKFKRDLEIDKMSRAAIFDMIKAVDGHHAANFGERLIDMQSKSTTIQSKTARGYIKAFVMVRTSLEDAAAYLFDYESRANRAFGDQKRKVVNRNGKFELLVKRTVIMEAKYGSFQQECEFYSTVNLYVVDNDTIAIVVDPVNSNAENSRDTRRLISLRMSFSTMGKVEGEEGSTVLLRRVGPMETKIEFENKLTFGMPLGKMIIKNELEHCLHGYKAMSSYYLNLLSGDKLGEINKNDGITLGEFLYEGGRASVKETISNSVILSSVKAEFPWFEAVLEEVLRNKLHPGSYSSATNADCLSITEGRRLGGTLAMSLATNVTTAGAVDEWILQQKALQEIDEKYCWIRPMMNAIALKLIGDVGWGLKLRVIIGAALSTLDLATDAFITYAFWKDGKEMFYKASLTMLGTSMFIMLFIVWVQNHKMGWKRVLVEMIPVVVGLKPAVDAYRIAAGAEIEEGQSFDPLTELTFCRGVEMFAEAIPGVIIQLSAILSDAGFSGIAIASLAVSALTTGFISASISYDWDSDPQNRIESPSFYGYLPNKSMQRAGEKRQWECEGKKCLFSTMISILTLSQLLFSCFCFNASPKRSHAISKGFSSSYVGARVANISSSLLVF